MQGRRERPYEIHMGATEDAAGIGLDGAGQVAEVPASPAPERGSAQRDSGPEAGMHCWKGHWSAEQSVVDAEELVGMDSTPITREQGRTGLADRCTDEPVVDRPTNDVLSGSAFEQIAISHVGEQKGRPLEALQEEVTRYAPGQAPA